jgi:NADH:ubiquinone oxidoreductase subunit H
MIIYVATLAAGAALLLLVMAIEARLDALTQARVGSRIGPLGLLTEPAALLRLALQQKQTLPKGGRVWIILWTGSLAGLLGLLPWGGDSEFMLLGIPILASIAALALHFISTTHLVHVLGGLVPLVLAILAVGLDTGSFSWVALEVTDGFPLGIRAFSKPSMALAAVLFWMSSQSAFGLAPLSFSNFETEYRRGMSGAILRVGQASARLILASFTVLVFLGGGPIYWVGIKAAALAIGTHLLTASLPKMRSDQWMRGGWRILFAAGILAVFLRGLNL